jgi:hypothetical protein
MLYSTVVELPFAADCCSWVGKLGTVLPLSDVIRDSAVQLVLAHQRAGFSVVRAGGEPAGSTPWRASSQVSRCCSRRSA